MRLKVLGSGSKDNCYILENKEEALVLEAGVSSKEVMKAINFDLKKVVGVLVTHEHQDHSKYIKEWRDRNIKIFASKGTQKAIDLRFYNYNHCSHLALFQAGNFKILPFDVQHDCNEPLGFLIYHPDMGNLLFATDTFYLKYCFANLNHIMIECNYCESLLSASDKPYKDRVLGSHMSLETCVECLQANDLSKTESIVLMHLSDYHSDEILMRQTVIAATGINTIIADKGVEIELGW